MSNPVRPTKLITEFVHPPIPDRTMDWSAHDDNYDADWDGERYVSSSIVGHGATEAEAVADYWEQWEERNGEVS